MDHALGGAGQSVDRVVKRLLPVGAADQTVESMPPNQSHRQSPRPSWGCLSHPFLFSLCVGCKVHVGARVGKCGEEFSQNADAHSLLQSAQDPVGVSEISPFAVKKKSVFFQDRSAEKRRAGKGWQMGHHHVMLRGLLEPCGNK